MKKCIVLLILLVGLNQFAGAQCDTSLINSVIWQVTSVSSEEPGSPGSNVLDGDSSTIWHTEYSASQPGFPHEIQIDLGQTYAINGVQYTPRQVGSLNGKVANYEIYLSVDGSN